MRVEKTVEEKYTILKLLEEKLDSRVSPALKNEMVLTNSKGVNSIIINLEEVKYADSSGLSALLTGSRVCKNSGGTFVVCCVNDFIGNLVKISRLDSVFTVLPTQEEAIEAVFMELLENEITQSSEE